MKHLSTLISTLLNSYSVIFFSQNKVFGAILFAVSFLHPVAGIAGLLAVILSNCIANFCGFNKEITAKGLYSFNALLTALGLTTIYEQGPWFWFILFLATLFTVMLSVIFSAWLGKYGLPILSLPFICSFWMVSLADHHLLKNSGAGSVTLLGSVLPDAIPGTFLSLVTSFFKSLSSIFFQYNVITGIMIAIGFLFYSRIGFSLLIIGFLSALSFELLSGNSHENINYYNFGANYMMTAVALGAFFVIPSWRSYLWAMIGVFFCNLLVSGLGRALLMWDLPVFSLPFSLVVILMLYFFMQRTSIKGLHLTAIQHYSPELNLYQFSNNSNRLKSLQYLPLSLPFMGEWMVSQGYDGDITHKGDWSKALDFVISDQEGKTFVNNGTQLKDFYCYNKPVLACADGYIEEVAIDFEDNAIGESDTVNNWGNSIVIRHGLGLYSKVSHLKKGSFKVKKGDYVYRGDILAACGNSGRSPEPHLHFQVQATPYIGSKTMEYPIGSFMVLEHTTKSFQNFRIPSEGTIVCDAPADPDLKKAFTFQPGYRIAFTNPQSNKTETWEVFTDAWNQSYIYSKEASATAYFCNNGTVFYFTNFYGNKLSMLYQFYLAAYQVIQSTGDGVNAGDTFPLSHSKFKQLLWLQDFAAPFYQFIGLDYQSSIKVPEDRSKPVEVISSQHLRYFGNKSEVMHAVVRVANGKIQSFATIHGNQLTEAHAVQN